jgi:integrase
MASYSSGPEQLRLFDFGGVDLGKLREIRESLRTDERAHQTVRGYASDWRVFQRWCADAGRSSLPADPETLSLYTTWLITDGGRRCSTALRHLASVTDQHKRAGHEPPSTNDARAVVLAVRRQTAQRPRGKAALSVADLAKAARACSGKTRLGTRDRALLVLGFATSLRRSELSRLQLADVSSDSRGLIVFVRKSKTDQEGRGRVIAVWPGKRAATDPVRTLKRWIAKRGRFAGPLFCRVTAGDAVVREGISGDAINDAVKRCVAAAGLDPTLYGAHSLRAGAVTAAAELGRSDQEIMGLSGHESAAVMRTYVRSGRLFSGRNPLAGAL